MGKVHESVALHQHVAAFHCHISASFNNSPRSEGGLRHGNRRQIEAFTASRYLPTCSLPFHNLRATDNTIGINSVGRGRSKAFSVSAVGDRRGSPRVHQVKFEFATFFDVFACCNVEVNMSIISHFDQLARAETRLRGARPVGDDHRPGAAFAPFQQLGHGKSRPSGPG